MSLTKKEIMAAIVRAGKDPVYFSNTYAKISHPLHGLIPFDMYEFQMSGYEARVVQHEIDHLD